MISSTLKSLTSSLKVHHMQMMKCCLSRNSRHNLNMDRDLDIEFEYRTLQSYLVDNMKDISTLHSSYIYEQSQ